MGQKCFVGVDLGGTNVRAQAYFEDGTPAGQRFESASNAQTGTEAIFEALGSVILQAAGSATSEVAGVGIAVPGHIDDVRGIVRWAPNFGHYENGVFLSWRDVPFKAPLAQRVPYPIVTGNDANLAALGEYRFGSGRGSAAAFCMLTLGTGIGGGVVLAPQSVQGAARGPLVLVGGNAGGAELGHIIVSAGGCDAKSGEYGALEGYCQRDAIIRRAQHRLQRGYPSLINEVIQGDLSKVTPRILAEAADNGDELAIEVWCEVGFYLGVGIGSIVNVFAPSVFAIGGQIAKAGKWILEPAKKAARNTAVPSLWEDCELVLAEQIEDAGVLGGVALAAQQFGD